MLPNQHTNACFGCKRGWWIWQYVDSVSGRSAVPSASPNHRMAITKFGPRHHATLESTGVHYLLPRNPARYSAAIPKARCVAASCRVRSCAYRFRCMSAIVQRFMLARIRQTVAAWQANNRRRRTAARRAVRSIDRRSRRSIMNQGRRPPS
jgi:hypothetical protein